YRDISRRTREWSADRRGEYWHSADALAMALALRPDGVVESVRRPLQVETEGRHTRGSTVVDWRGPPGEGVDIMLRYDQAQFESLVQAAQAATCSPPGPRLAQGTVLRDTAQLPSRFPA